MIIPVILTILLVTFSSALTEGTQTQMLCCDMKFSLKLHKDTNGFDPLFLSLAEVKQNCINSHKDLAKVGMSDLAYCSKELGTL